MEPIEPGPFKMERYLKRLNFRMYSLFNEQSIVDEGPQSFVFQTDGGRVQSARKWRKMDDYPCKFAGGRID